LVKEKSKKILVIGDAMLDTYIYGNVKRVSPEAPVPVLCPENIQQYLGGAANVARNAAALGADVSVVFAIGKDPEGEIVINRLKEWSINCAYLLQDEALSTINKVRIVGNRQQIVRIDYNDHYEITKYMNEALEDKLTKAISEADIVIISDYAKGTCTRQLLRKVIDLSDGKPVLVDPKGSDWSDYYGASIITPNLKEINEFSGNHVMNDSEEITAAYGSFYSKIGTNYILVTRSDKGMTLIGDDVVKHFPVFSQEVFDVSGAGDTAIAALACFLDVNLENIEEAVKIANIAAGIAVAKPGTAVVKRDEIFLQIARKQYEDKASKIYRLDDYDRLEKTIRLWKTAGNSIVTANGCFDIVHRGHIKLLTEAKKYGDRLIVALNSNDSVKRLKGENRPINDEIDRAYVIAALEVVDAVVIFDSARMPVIMSDSELSEISEKAKNNINEAPMALMRMVRPDVHVKGGDYIKEDLPEAIYAGATKIIAVEEGYSTTETINKINY